MCRAAENGYKGKCKNVCKFRHFCLLYFFAFFCWVSRAKQETIFTERSERETECWQSKMENVLKKAKVIGNLPTVIWCIQFEWKFPFNATQYRLLLPLYLLLSLRLPFKAVASQHILLALLFSFNADTHTHMCVQANTSTLRNQTKSKSIM